MDDAVREATARGDPARVIAMGHLHHVTSSALDSTALHSQLYSDPVTSKDLTLPEVHACLVEPVIFVSFNRGSSVATPFTRNNASHLFIAAQPEHKHLLVLIKAVTILLCRSTAGN